MLRVRWVLDWLGGMIVRVKGATGDEAMVLFRRKAANVKVYL